MTSPAVSSSLAVLSGPAPFTPESVAGMQYALQTDNAVNTSGACSSIADRVASLPFAQATVGNRLLIDTATLPGHTVLAGVAGSTRNVFYTDPVIMANFDAEIYSFGVFCLVPGGNPTATLINMRNSATTADGLMRLTPSSTSFILQTDGQSGSQSGPTIAWTDTQPAWAHYSFTRDAGGTVSAYVNGVLAGTGSVAAKAPLFEIAYCPASTSNTVEVIYGGWWGASDDLAAATHLELSDWYFQSFGM